MRYALVTLFTLLLLGCGTTSAVRLASEVAQEQPSFLLLDERPPQQKSSRNEEGSDGKNLYFGDDNFTPTGPELVKAALHKKLGAELSGKSVTLTDFVVNVYEPAIAIDREGMRNVAASVPNGYAAEPLAELLVFAIESMRSEKNVNVQITGRIDDLVFSGNLSDTFKGRVSESNIKATVEKALEEVADQIQGIVTARNRMQQDNVVIPIN